MKNKVTTEAIEHTASCLFSKMLDIGFPKGEYTYELLVNGEIVGHVITEKYGNHMILSAFIGDKSIYVEDFITGRGYRGAREDSLMIRFCKCLAMSLLYNFEVELVNINRC